MHYSYMVYGQLVALSEVQLSIEMRIYPPKPCVCGEFLVYSRYTTF